MVRGVGLFFVGIFREFWVGKGWEISFSGFEKKGNIFKLEFCFYTFWHRTMMRWFFLMVLNLGFFPFMNILFCLLFMVYMCFPCVYFCLLLNPTYLVGLDVLIGDRLEKSVLSLMGLMRTDPPFLRRENKVVKEKTEREINTEEKKVGTILRKKKWKTRRRKNNNG